MSSGTSISGVKQWDGTQQDYPRFRRSIFPILRSMECENVISKPKPIYPSDVKNQYELDERWSAKNSKALGLLANAMGTEGTKQAINEFDLAKEAWEWLDLNLISGQAVNGGSDLIDIQNRLLALKVEQFATDTNRGYLAYKQEHDRLRTQLGPEKDPDTGEANQYYVPDNLIAVTIIGRLDKDLSQETKTFAVEMHEDPKFKVPDIKTVWKNMDRWYKQAQARDDKERLTALLNAKHKGHQANPNSGSSDRGRVKCLLCEKDGHDTESCHQLTRARTLLKQEKQFKQERAAEARQNIKASRGRKTRDNADKDAAKNKCVNPGCKNPTTHRMENCTAPGGGREGQKWLPDKKAYRLKNGSIEKLNKSGQVAHEEPESSADNTPNDFLSFLRAGGMLDDDDDWLSSRGGMYQGRVEQPANPATPPIAKFMAELAAEGRITGEFDASVPAKGPSNERGFRAQAMVATTQPMENLFEPAEPVDCSIKGNQRPAANKAKPTPRSTLPPDDSAEFTLEPGEVQALVDGGCSSGYFPILFCVKEAAQASTYSIMGGHTHTTMAAGVAGFTVPKESGGAELLRVPECNFDGNKHFADTNAELLVSHTDLGEMGYRVCYDADTPRYPHPHLVTPSGDIVRMWYLKKGWYLKIKPLTTAHHEQQQAYLSRFPQGTDLSRLPAIKPVEMTRAEAHTRFSHAYGQERLDDLEKVTCDVVIIKKKELGDFKKSNCLSCVLSGMRRQAVQPTPAVRKTVKPAPPSKTKQLAASVQPFQITSVDGMGPFVPAFKTKAIYWQKIRDSGSGLKGGSGLRLRSEAGPELERYFEAKPLPSEMHVPDHYHAMLLSDNGKEYVQGICAKLNKARNTSHMRTAPYTPEENAADEAWGKQLRLDGKSMIMYAGLPKSTWECAFKTRQYTGNKGPDSAATTSLGRPASSIEACTGVKPSGKDCHTFGCDMIGFIPVQKRRKGTFDDNAELLCFLGYGDNKKVFIGFSLKTFDLVEVGTNAVFFEREFSIAHGMREYFAEDDYDTLYKDLILENLLNPSFNPAALVQYGAGEPSTVGRTPVLGRTRIGGSQNLLFPTTHYRVHRRWNDEDQESTPILTRVRARETENEDASLTNPRPVTTTDEDDSPTRTRSTRMLSELSLTGGEWGPRMHASPPDTSPGGDEANDQRDTTPGSDRQLRKRRQPQAQQADRNYVETNTTAEIRKELLEVFSPEEAQVLLEKCCFSFDGLDEQERWMAWDHVCGQSMDVQHYQLGLKAKVVDAEPRTLKQAKDSEDWPEYRLAMQAQMDSIFDERVFTRVNRPENIKNSQILPLLWVFDKKYDVAGVVTRYRARLVCDGSRQVHGVNLEEAFASVIRMESLRTIMALAAQYDLLLDLSDVSTAFLNATMEGRHVYCYDPPHYKQNDGKLLKLNKYLYGLSESPRAWGICLKEWLVSQDFNPIDADPCVYVRRQSGKVTIVGVYTDDILLAYSDKQTKDEFLSALRARFKIKEFGTPDAILNMEITRDWDKGSITLSSRRYIRKICERFGFECGKLKKATTPNAAAPLKRNDKNKSSAGTQFEKIYQAKVGALIHLSRTTFPSISFAVNQCSRFMQAPEPEHMEAVDAIYRYIAFHEDMHMTYTKDPKGLSLMVLSDASYASDKDTRRSVSGACAYINMGMVLWFSGVQKSVTLSTAEAELDAATSGGKALVWLQRFLVNLGFTEFRQGLIANIGIDNTATIAITRNEEHHDRTKHIEIKLRWLCEKVRRGAITPIHVPTWQNSADVLTKYLSVGLYTIHAHVLHGKRSYDSITEAEAKPQATLNKPGPT